MLFKVKIWSHRRHKFALKRNPASESESDKSVNSDRTVLIIYIKTMSNKTLLTQEGYQKLALELEDLKTKRDHLITQIEEVAQPDESGEDGLATQLKEELEVVNEKVGNIENALETAEIISGKLPKDMVQVGSKVKIKLSGKNEVEFNIVSHLEADPTQNKISDQSPLGQALLGRKLHDEVEVEAPVGKITYKIIAIA